MTEAEDPLEQVRAIFREEGKDLIQKLQDGLLQLERARGPARAEVVRDMMREAHNLKGAASSIGLKATSDLAHALESALEHHEELAKDASAFDVLNQGVDALLLSLDDRRMHEGGAKALAALRSLVAGPPSEKEAVPGPVPLAPAAEAVEAEARPGYEDSLRIGLPRLTGLMLEAGEVALRLQGAHERTRELRAHGEQLAEVLRSLATSLGPADERTLRVADAQRGLASAVNRFEYQALHDALLGESLHASIRSLRMRPLSSVFRLLPRMARDLGRTLGKEVALTVAGSSIDVEKSVIDLVRDAMVHLIRNAMDHGLEAANERAAAGKPPVGRVHVAARLQGSWLLIEVTDDGRGVDPGRVKQAAVAAKLLSAREAEVLQPEAAQDLIFHAGLSTRGAATEISGRGVGLDAVRTQVERSRGTIRVTSQPGQGTTFVLQVPLVTHRTHVLLLRVGAEKLALPTASVWKVKLLGRAQRPIAGQQAVELDGVVVPIVQLPPLLWSTEPGRLSEEASLVVLRSQGRAVACAADELLLDEEVMVREIEPPLECPAILSGVAVRNNGELICILNPMEIVKLAGVRAPLAAPEQLPRAPTRARRVLVVDDSFTVRTLEKSILELAGYEVLTSSDGDEALKALAREHVDVVVSDINMPHKDGFELLGAVRLSPRLRALPFILVTSRSSDADRRRGLELGASAYVVKSEFDQEVLVDAVARLAG